MASVWLFTCLFGLAQEQCGDAYQVDKLSRGWQAKFRGCPSCKHRIAANRETASAEDAYARLLYGRQQQE